MRRRSYIYCHKKIMKNYFQKIKKKKRKKQFIEMEHLQPCIVG